MAGESPLWAESERLLVRYLLGDLPAEEQAALEERLFVEDGVHEDLLATSDGLIRAYLAGKLTNNDRRRFEGHFLASPRMQERFDFLKTMVQAIREERAAAPSARHRSQAWLGLAAALLAGLGVYFVLQRIPRGERQADLNTPSPAPSPAMTETVTPPPRATPSAGRTTAPSSPPPRSETRMVALPSAGGSIDVDVTGAVKTVRFELPVEARLEATFEAKIRGADGAAAWEATALMPRAPGEPLVIDVPTRVLVADAYELIVRPERLRDATPDPARDLKYSLRISRRRPR